MIIVKFSFGILVTLVISLSLLPTVPTVTAQNSNGMQTFLPSQDLSGNYVGLSVQFNATREANPGENITIQVWVNCTAEDVNVEDFHFDIYAFQGGQEKIQLDTITLLEDTYLPFNETRKFNYTVHLPSDVWGTTYIEMYLKYTVVDTPVERTPSFLTTMVRNVYLEELKNKFNNLNETYHQLNESFRGKFQMPLNNQSLTTLNQTYWELKHNYTSMQGNLGQLENTRRIAILLAITTVFFIGTTVYVITQKPERRYW